ncbi:hypothetical protein V493_03488 [Pseudogymnoascus sp. VKM F-4281 (FW-2241)]|nr:hypothetical protein V493_03488 [Pseudogymnoascus sp. VKM F-4281 (FW-2241)]
MSKPKVLLLGEIDHAHKDWSDLASIADVLTPTSTNRADFIKESQGGAFDGVIAAYRTFQSVSITGLIDDELVSSLPKSLKYLSHNGAGYDQIDVSACTKHDIRVSNTPSAVDDATADANMFLILGALRNFNTSMVALRAGNWRGVPNPSLGHDPQGKVLGILGMGGIGRNLKIKAEAFGMTVQYHNRTQLSEELSGGAKYVSFEELLATSDVLSLNLPLNKNTRHIISTPQFALMKDGVVIVNTARGAVIDEAALVEALNSGKVGSAGLDVYEEEPKIHPGLVACERAILLPHMGTWTVETQTKMERWTIENVKMAVQEGTLKSPVWEQKGM